MEKRRVVITGVGLVTPIGMGVEENWDSLMKGKSGVSKITRFDTSNFPVQIAGEVKGFNPENYIDKKDIKQMDVFIQYAVTAAKEAFKQSGYEINDANSEMVGALVGAGLGGLPEIERNHSELVEKGPRRVSPFFIPRSIANLAPGQISILFNARGPNACTVTACATGTHSIGDAYRIIERGDADAMFAGGAESTITPLAVAGFAQMKALSTSNDQPEKASRPFDKERNGFVIGEGSGIVFMEELEGAKKRGAKILAEIIGYGLTSDAYHVSAPSPEGEGANRCMRNAIRSAGLPVESVDYINAHGTSTYYNDLNETIAIKNLFRDHARKLKISSTKSMTGHLLGAAGGIEAIYTALALERGIVPPTTNYEHPDPECDLDYVPNEPQETKPKIALSNSFGFGGTNACLCFKKYE